MAPVRSADARGVDDAFCRAMPIGPREALDAQLI